MPNQFDAAAFTAAELLGYFKRNTAVNVVHGFGSDTLLVKSARTGNTIATVKRDRTNGHVLYVVNGFDFLSLEIAARFIYSMARFPKPKKMNRSWSPIRLTPEAKAIMEKDAGYRVYL